VNVDFTAILEHAFGPFLGAVAAYLAIREDIATLKAQMRIALDSADKAHARIDRIMGRDA
jgi:hypothetical protein